MLTTELTDLIDNAAAGVARAYRVERDDISQEMWAWALEHDKSIQRNLDSGNEWRISRGLWTAGKRYALAEKAATSGYSLDDLYFYSVGEIADVLPYVLGLESPVDAVLAANDPQKPSVHEDELATRMGDVASGLLAIAPADRQFMKTVIECNRDWEEIGEITGALPKSARNRWNRMLKRLQRTLGGSDPWNRGDRTGSRKAVSNARARAITSHQEGAA